MIDTKDFFSGLQTFYLFTQRESHIIQIMQSCKIYLNLINNILMVAVTMKTSQINVISTYLTLNLAFSDISFQVLGIIPCLQFSVNRAPCNFETTWNVIRHLTFISKFFVVHISYDRYKHHKNPNLYDRIMMFNKVKCYQLLSTVVALSITGFSFLNCSVLELTIPLHMLVPLLTIVIMVEYSYI